MKSEYTNDGSQSPKTAPTQTRCKCENCKCGRGALQEALERLVTTGRKLQEFSGIGVHPRVRWRGTAYPDKFSGIEVHSRVTKRPL